MILLSKEGSETITFRTPKWCNKDDHRFPMMPAPKIKTLEFDLIDPAVAFNLFQP